jgi:hypothetical protein
MSAPSGSTASSASGWSAATAAARRPSLPMLMVANLLPLLPGAHTPVALRFVPQGGGSWLVDDVSVDPYKRL